MRKVSIGYYAHHHGSGHLKRALHIARCMDRPLTVFSSAPPPDPVAGVDFRALDADTGEALVQSGPASLPASLHYAPLGLPGIAARAGVMVDWFRAAWPCVLVVDVSVEVALLARLCAVPTILIRQNGMRTDAPHTLAYDSATALLAPFPDAFDAHPEADPWRAKTVFTGFISRYSDPSVSSRVASPSPSSTPSKSPSPAPSSTRAASDTVVVLVGHGGTALTCAGLCAAAAATPTWQWSVLGPVALDPASPAPANQRMHGVVPDPADHLRHARIVVGSAGDNVVAEMAALRCRYIALSEPRPFDEQRLTAEALDRLGLALHCPRWPDAAAWPALLHRALALEPSRWDAVARQAGAPTAARTIQTIADRVWTPDARELAP